MHLKPNKLLSSDTQDAGLLQYLCVCALNSSRILVVHTRKLIKTETFLPSTFFRSTTCNYWVIVSGLMVSGKLFNFVFMAHRNQIAVLKRREFRSGCCTFREKNNTINSYFSCVVITYVNVTYYNCTVHIVQDSTQL